MWQNPQETPDLVTFTEEIFNWKLHFLCSASMRDIGKYFKSLFFDKRYTSIQALHDYFYFVVANLFNFLRFALAVTIKLFQNSIKH